MNWPKEQAQENSSSWMDRWNSIRFFLKLTNAKVAIVEMKLRLASKLRGLRHARKFTQKQLTSRIGSIAILKNGVCRQFSFNRAIH